MRVWDRLERVTPPASPPVTLADAKLHAKVDHDVADTVLQVYLDAAIAEVDGPSGLGVAMLEQSWKLSLDSFPDVIPLPIGPVRSVTEIAYTDTDGADQTIDPATVQVITRRIDGRILPEPGNTWPATEAGRWDAVRVTWSAGWDTGADDLQRLRHAIMVSFAQKVADTEAPDGRATWNALTAFARQRIHW